MAAKCRERISFPAIHAHRQGNKIAIVGTNYYFSAKSAFVKTSRIGLSLLLLLFCSFSFAQKKSATVNGKVIGENENILTGVSVTILGQSKGVTTTDSGTFSIKVPADRAFALVFSYTGYKPFQQNFLLNENELEQVTIRMEAGEGTMEEVIVKDQRERAEVGLIRPNPKNDYQSSVSHYGCRRFAEGFCRFK